MQEDRCICGHVAQGHNTCNLSEFPFWDISDCKYTNCECEKFTRHDDINKE